MPKKKETPKKEARQEKPHRSDKKLIAIYEALEDADMLNVSSNVLGVRISNPKRCVFVRYKGDAVYGTDKVPQKIRKAIHECLSDPDQSVSKTIREHLGSSEKMAETKFRRLI